MLCDRSLKEECQREKGQSEGEIQCDWVCLVFYQSLLGNEICRHRFGIL